MSLNWLVCSERYHDGSCNCLFCVVFLFGPDAIIRKLWKCFAKQDEVRIEGFLHNYTWTKFIDHKKYNLGGNKFIGTVRLPGEPIPTFVRARCTVVKMGSNTGYVLFFRCDEFPGAIIHEIA